MNEKYVEFVGGMMYPKSTTGPFGFQLDKGRVSLDHLHVRPTCQSLYFPSRLFLTRLHFQSPTERVNTLGYLLSPLRTASVMGKASVFLPSLEVLISLKFMLSSVPNHFVP